MLTEMLDIVHNANKPIQLDSVEASFLAHLSEGSQSDLIGRDSSRIRACVRSHLKTLMSRRPDGRCNQILSEASLVGERLHEVLVQIRTLVSMVADSSYSVIMGKMASSSIVFEEILFICAGNDDIHKSLNEFKIWPDSTTDNGVSCR